MFRSHPERSGGAGWQLLALTVAVALSFVLLALIHPLDHDESQYVAAAVLALDGLPYRDFAFLQTPLQPLLLAPLTLIAPGWTFVVLRVANALFGAGSVLLVAVAVRRAGAERRAATIAAALYACCAATLFVSGVARNDALPALFEAAALAVVIGRGDPRWRSALAGLFFGLAAATKISFAFPAAAVMLLAAVRRDKDRLSAPWLAAGLAGPVALVAALASRAPDAFWFEVLTFPALAPAEWYRATGQAFRLGLGHPIDVVRNLAIGPALLATAVVAQWAWRARREPWSFEERVFAGGAFAGAIAMALPTPSYPQYQVPFLVPLFMALGLRLDDVPRFAGLRWLWVGFAGLGLWPSGATIAKALKSRSSAAIEVSRSAQAVGLALRDLPAGGTIGGLSPHLYVDAARPIDARFAGGPFVYRTEHLLATDEVRRWHLLTRGTVGLLAIDPPGAIVVGGEGTGTGAALDASLAAAAAKLGYRERAVVGRLHVLTRRTPAASPPTAH